jgi:hypothetical protein
MSLPLVALLASPASAQGIVYGTSIGYGYTRVTGRGAVTVGIRKVRVVAAPGFFGEPYAYGLYGPFGLAPVRQVTLLYSAPPPQPVIVINLPPPVFVEDPEVIVERPDRRPDAAPRPLERDNRNPAPKVKPKPVLKEEPKPAKPRVERPRGAEADRLTDRGQDAFAAGEYGRAADHFRRAIEADPNEGPAHFLLAQAFFALGKYREAVEAIREGLVLRPDWPAAPLPPLKLYGPDAEPYLEQMRLLEDAIGRHPEDPVLLFLDGYQRWINGRRGEGREQLLRARRHGGDARAIDRFLRTPPAGLEL